MSRSYSLSSFGMMRLFSIQNLSILAFIKDSIHNKSSIFREDLLFCN